MQRVKLLFYRICSLYSRHIHSCCNEIREIKTREKLSRSNSFIISIFAMMSSSWSRSPLPSADCKLFDEIENSNRKGRINYANAAGILPVVHINDLYRNSKNKKINCNKKKNYTTKLMNSAYFFRTFECGVVCIFLYWTWRASLLHGHR